MNCLAIGILRGFENRRCSEPAVGELFGPLRPLLHPALDQPAFAAGTLFVALKVLVISLSGFPAVADAGPDGIVVLVAAKKRDDLQVAKAFVEQIDFRV